MKAIDSFETRIGVVADSSLSTGSQGRGNGTVVVDVVSEPVRYVCASRWFAVSVLPLAMYVNVCVRVCVWEQERASQLP